MTVADSSPDNRTTTGGVTFIAGLPYSGSTLFASALGNTEGFVNCGEINYLEQDWHDHRRCSCGELLSDCPFWGPLSQAAHERAARGDPMLHLDAAAKYHPIYHRHQPLRRRLAALMGMHPRRIYGAASVDRHMAETLGFLRLVLETTGSDEVIDASKNLLRLRLLAEQDDLPLRVIVISRRPADALGARIKRARRRTKWYRQAFAPVYILWLLYHGIQMRRTLRRIPDKQIFRASYEDFVSDPAAMEIRLSDWYGRPISFGRIRERDVNLQDTHVYTGNSWLTRGRDPSRVAHLRPPQDRPELTRLELAQFRLASAVLPILKHRP